MHQDPVVSPNLPGQYLSKIPPLLLQHLPVVEVNQTIVTHPEVLFDTTWLVLIEASPEAEQFGRNLIVNPVMFTLAGNVMCRLLMERSVTLIHFHVRKEMHRTDSERRTVPIPQKETYTRSWPCFTVNGTLDVGRKCSSDTEQTLLLSR
jgi:hypothetical protein